MPDLTDKLNHFTAAALLEAAGESEALLAGAKARRETALTAAEDAALHEAYHFLRREAARVRGEAGAAVSRRMLENRRALARRREEMARAVLDEVGDKLSAFTTTPAYAARLGDLLAAACGLIGPCESLTVYLREADMPLAGGLGSAAAPGTDGLNVQAGGFALGGLIAECPARGMRVDASFDTALAELESELLRLLGAEDMNPAADAGAAPVAGHPAGREAPPQGAALLRGVNGPVVTAVGGQGLSMLELAAVGDEGLLGEVVGVEGGITTIQVYEDTTGLAPGQPVVGQGTPLSVLLGPGLLGHIFDGIARPLTALEGATGPFLGRGVNLPALDLEKTWDVSLCVSAGDVLTPGMCYATCPETTAILHRCTVPPGVSGTVASTAADGAYTVDDPIVTLTDGRVLKLAQIWPVRRARPIGARRPITQPLLTGQRVIDTLFPVGKGGCAAIPGPFGAGKTMTQHQLAKWSDADIIVYLGCGERGNEMTQALEEFSALVDPRSGLPLMNRTILIANTSNMPVAAREASVYTGMTIAEYYRDMGYHVALMADSTSRWAEALREISGRLEEMPAEEGFPAYLASRLAEFYERAGYVETLEGREGSVTVIGAVSPQGGDFSEPVTQNTRRYVRTFWGLDRALAYARHFPAIHWMTSYSEYAADLAPWYETHAGTQFIGYRGRMMGLLQEEAALMEIVKLIGADILPEEQKLIVETARLIRVGFLQQNAYHAVDTYVPIEKQMGMMELMLYLYDGAAALIARAIPFSQIRETGVFDRLIKMKYEVPNDQLRKFDDYRADIHDSLARVSSAND